MAGDDVAGEERCNHCVNLWPLGSVADAVFVDPVDVHVNRIKIVLRVYQPLPGRLRYSIAKWDYSDLADAGEIWIGSFNIDHDEVHRMSVPVAGLNSSIVPWDFCDGISATSALLESTHVYPSVPA